MEAPPNERREGWHLTGAAREEYVRGLFDGIAEPYDRLNRVISLGRDPKWRRLAVELSGVRPGDRVLDLGTGTGDLALAFAEVVGPGGTVVGVDIAEGMLARARAKQEAANLRHVVFKSGNAQASGEPGAAFDVVSMGWVLRNVGDRAAVYREVLRVLAPGGRFVCLEMSRPTGVLSRGGFWLYRHLAMPVLARLAGGKLSAYRYLAGSTDGFPDAFALAAELGTAGFRPVQHRSLMLGSLAIHVATRPA